MARRTAVKITGDAPQAAPARPAYEVEAKQYIVLTIPNGSRGYYGGGPVDYRATFSAEDAQGLAQALASAALEIR